MIVRVCSPCRLLWGALIRCPRCQGELHGYGEREDDFTLPPLNRFPMKKALRIGQDPDPSQRPNVRDPIEAWVNHAVALGYDPDEVRALTKVELRALVDRHEATGIGGVPVDVGL